MFGQVINRVGKIQILVLNRVKALGSGPHNPAQFFWEYLPRALINNDVKNSIK